MPDIKEAVKETVSQEVDRVKNLTTDAARSGAYFYPIKGIIYYITHRQLWKPLLSKLAPTVTLAVGVVTFMFVFTYLPQVAVLSFVNGPLAVFSTVLLVLSESSTLITVLSKSFLIDDALVDTFDGILMEQNLTNLVSEGRQINPHGDSIGKLGKLIKKPFAKFSPQAIIRYLMYLPLNAIPVVGTAIFIILQGKKMGPSFHNRYFQLKGWSSSKREKFIEEHQGAYTGFGLVTTLLELVPIASIFFSFTNTAGAALWAADIERGNGSTAPNLREQAKKAE